MPRLISAVPKYARHKRSGKAFVRIHGKQIQLGKYGTPESRQAYDRLIAEWMASNRSQLPSRGPDHNKLTVAELALAFLEFALGYYPKRQTRRGCLIAKHGAKGFRSAFRGFHPGVGDPESRL